QYDLLAVHAHAAGAWQEVAGDHLDQRRLARTVVAHESDDLARLQRQRYFVQRPDGAEVLGHVLQFQDGHAPDPPSSTLYSGTIRHAAVLRLTPEQHSPPCRKAIQARRHGSTAAPLPLI